jgi:hypothetical protein
MKKILTSNVLDPSQLQPFTAQSLRFLQESKEDDVAAIIKSIVTQNIGSYSLTVPYVISGCVVSDGGKDVTAGEVFYGGKYYETTAVNGTTNIARFILTASQDATADPLTFSNSSVFNVHTIYKYVATDVAIDGDFTSADLNFELVASSSKIYSNIYSAAGFTVNNGVGYDNLTSMTYTTPNDGITRNYVIEYKGTATTSNGVVDSNCQLRIYNTTDSALLDSAAVGKSNMSAATEVIVIPVFMSTGVITLAPNKTILVQGGMSANNITFTFNRMSITEFK